jgi:hypothetical protein
VYGQIEVEKSKKQSKKLTVRLRPRGKSRRLMCDFPPLKLKFDKDELLANGIQQFNDFKLVTHCIEGDAKSEALIKKEYLVYQLCNKMTPYSFNAKLVRITYKNKGSSFKKMTHLGILIEDAESLANRNNCEVTASKVINLDSMHTNHEKIASMFQYMIGNADWSYMMGRNMELIRTSERFVIPVPYDFDYAGLVKAHYARANAALGQKTVLDRVYLGNAKHFNELVSMISYFKTKKEELLTTIEGFEELSNENRQEMKDYILDFYAIIESRERVEKEMLKKPTKE